MSTLFLDTSALVKLHVQETGTEALIVEAGRHRLAYLSVARVEFWSAVWRRCRTGDIEAEAAEALTRTFDVNASTFHVVAVSEEILDRACALTRVHGLRAYDAFQLAAALDLGRGGLHPVFVAADLALLEAARKEGLGAWNPAVQSAPPM